MLVLTGLHAQERVVAEFVPLQAEYDAKSKAQVIQPCENAVADMRAKYLTALENACASAQQTGKLEEALAYKAEVESVVTTKSVPSTDAADVGVKIHGERIP